METVFTEVRLYAERVGGGEEEGSEMGDAPGYVNQRI